jgi:hypothetical protein
MRTGATAVVLVLLLAGCGSSREAATTGGSPMTEVEYRRQATVACAGLNDQIRRLARPRREADIAPLLHQILDLEGATIARLTGLDPPPSLRTGHRRFVALSRRIYGVQSRQVEAIEGGGRPLAVLRRSFAEQQQITQEANRVAARLGLSECAVTPQPRGTPSQSA